MITLHVAAKGLCPKCGKTPCSEDVVRGTRALIVRTCLAGHVWWEDPFDEQRKPILTGAIAPKFRKRR